MNTVGSLTSLLAEAGKLHDEWRSELYLVAIPKPKELGDRIAILTQFEKEQFLGERQIGDTKHLVYSWFADDSKAYEVFAEFANRASGLLVASPRSIRLAVNPDCDLSNWTVALFSAKAAEDFVHKFESSGLSIYKPWAASIAVLRSMIDAAKPEALESSNVQPVSMPTTVPTEQAGRSIGVTRRILNDKLVNGQINVRKEQVDIIDDSDAEPEARVRAMYESGLTDASTKSEYIAEFIGVSASRVRQLDAWKNAQKRKPRKTVVMKRKASTIDWPKN